MAAFVLSNATGLVRQILVSQAFGTQADIDAFNAAAQLPETLFVLVAGGALSSAFIPTISGFLTRDDRAGAWRLTSAVLNLISLILAALSLLAVFFAPPIVHHLLAPSFDPVQQALTVSLLRVLLLSPIVFGISGLLMGVLNAHQHFLLPALAPTLNWLGWIVGVVVFAPVWGIHGLAWGAVLGACLHLGVQIPALRKLSPEYTFTLGLDVPAVREVARLMGPRLIGVAVVQLNFWVNVILASGQPEGSLTAIKIAFAVMTMPQVVVAQAIAIAALPTFSALVSRGELSEMRTSLGSTLRGVVLLSLPATLGLILLRRPLVVLLFERGEFDERSTQLVAWALLWYTLGLVSHSVVEIVARAFYALHDTKTPVFIGSAAMALNVVFSIAFAAWFKRVGWLPHGGLALGNTLATTLEMIGLLAIMRRRLNGLGGRRALPGVAKALAATAAMSVGLLIWLNLSWGAPVWLVALGGVAVGGAIYAAGTLVLGVDEAREVVAFVQNKLRSPKV